MRVTMTRTVEQYLIGEAYDIDDRLAQVWCHYGICDPTPDSPEGSETPAEGEDDREPAESGEDGERAVQRRVK